MQFKLAPDLTIDSDDDRVKKQGLRVAVIAESGGGKSHTIAVIAEQAKQQGLQVVFFDTHGEYWTFSEVFEDVLVVGGDNADLPLEEAAIDVYAEAYRQGKSLDFSFKEIFTDDELYSSLAEKLLRALWKVQVNEPRPSLWILEEAQILCPQEKSFDVVRRVGLVKNIATGGRKFGLSFILSTQRPAEIHKTPLSQCWIRLFGKVTEPRDQAALKPLLVPQKPEALAHLKTGQFYIYGWTRNPKLEEITSERRTKSAGDTLLIAPISRVSSKETSSIKEFKAQILEMLKKTHEEQSELASLRSKIGHQEKEMEELREKANIASVIKDSFLKTQPFGGSEVLVETVNPQTLAKLEHLGQIEQELALAKQQLSETRQELLSLEPYVQLKDTFSRIFNHTPHPTVDPAKADWVPLWLSKLPESPKKILQFLSEHQGVKYTTAQLAQLTGYSASGGSYKAALSTLKRNNLINVNKAGEVSLRS